MSETKAVKPAAPKQNLYEKLADIGESVKVLKKDKSGFGYKYVEEADILARIQGGMREKKVSLVPRIIPDTTHWNPRDFVKDVTDKSGTRYEAKVRDIVVDGQMMFTWVNNEDPEETIEVPWYFVGQQGDASQAYGSALTYASRYFLLRYFNIATSNDPDALIAKKKAEEAAKEKKILDDLVAQIRDKLNAAAAADEKAIPKLQEIVKKHAGTQELKKITDPAVAAALLAELNKEEKSK